MKHWSVFCMISLLFSSHDTQSSADKQRLDTHQPHFNTPFRIINPVKFIAFEKHSRDLIINLELQERTLTRNIMQEEQEIKHLTLEQRIARIDQCMSNWRSRL